MAARLYENVAVVLAVDAAVGNFVLKTIHTTIGDGKQAISSLCRMKMVCVFRVHTSLHIRHIQIRTQTYTPLSSTKMRHIRRKHIARTVCFKPIVCLFILVGLRSMHSRFKNMYARRANTHMNKVVKLKNNNCIERNNSFYLHRIWKERTHTHIVLESR